MGWGQEVGVKLRSEVEERSQGGERGPGGEPRKGSSRNSAHTHRLRPLAAGRASLLMNRLGKKGNFNIHRSDKPDNSVCKQIE